MNADDPVRRKLLEAAEAAARGPRYLVKNDGPNRWQRAAISKIKRKRAKERKR